MSTNDLLRDRLTSSSPSTPPVIDLTSDHESPSPRLLPPPSRPSESGPSIIEPVSHDVRRADQTNLVRTPRFGRNLMSRTPEFIDLSSVSEEMEATPGPSPSTSNAANAPSLPRQSSSSSSDVEYLSSRPIHRDSSAAMAAPAPAPSNLSSALFQPFTAGYSNLRDLLINGSLFMNSGRHILEGTDEPQASSSNAREREHLFEREVQRISMQAARNNRRRPVLPRLFPSPPPRLLPAPHNENLDLNMDYRHVAFAIEGPILVEDHSLTPPRRPSPPYKAPAPVAEGFTRKVEEEHVVICLNCEDELGTGDGEIKRQVWVSKQCGHVRHSRIPDICYPTNNEV